MDIPDRMRCMLLVSPLEPLQEAEMAVPVPGPDQVLLKVHACGVCRTDLHVADGDLPHPKLPLIMGHEIVGSVIRRGAHVAGFEIGARVGVPWLGSTDGTCAYCATGRENLCDGALYTGYSLDGGYAEYAVADGRFCHPLPPGHTDAEIAPLLCAGLIGYRSYRMAGRHSIRLGFYGFGAAAHLLIQLAVFEGKKIFAFTRPGDSRAQHFARRMGAIWAGSSDELPPEPLDAAILFAPVGSLVPQALRATAKGGIVVCGGIHMSEIPAFPYKLLWEERSICSVANLTRQDGIEFLKLAHEASIRAEIRIFPLEQANEALDALRSGNLEGAAVLQIHASGEPLRRMRGRNTQEELL
jgi:propanol-preferring alcohol dehydrogenase